MSIDYIKSIGQSPGWDYSSMASEEAIHSLASTKAARQDILKSIKASLELAVSRGLSKQETVKLVTQRLKTSGLWGKTYIRDPRSGQSRFIRDISPYRVETILRTNIQGAYMANRWAFFQSAKDETPYLQYVTQDDDLVRPSHRLLHGKVWPINHPIWKKIYPPNGYNCRCFSTNLTEEEALAIGIETSGRVPKGFPDNGFDTNMGINRFHIFDAFGARISGMNVAEARGYMLSLLISSQMVDYFSDFYEDRSVRDQAFVGYLDPSKSPLDEGRAIWISKRVLDDSGLKASQKAALPSKLLKSKRLFLDGDRVVVLVRLGLLSVFAVTIQDNEIVSITPQSEEDLSILEPL